MADSNFKSNIDALMGGMESYLNTKTVVGQAVTVGDTTILPLADVSFGVGAGVFEGNEKNRGGGAMGAKINPTAMLIITDGNARIVSVKDDPSLFEKIIDMAPGIISKFTKKGKDDAAEDIL